jgi:DNA-binding transcriptional LysR family regulator
LDTRTYRFFEAVARAGSFSKAARQLGVSQPAVSLQIQAIEGFYQTELLSRGADGCRLTAAGEIVLRYARQVLDLERLSLDEVRNVVRTTGGTLSVGTVFTISPYLPAILARFKQTYPAINLRLYVSNAADVAGRLREGELDLIVTPLTDGWTRTMKCEPVTDYALVLCVRADHPWARRGRIDAGELSAAPLVLREPGAVSRERLERVLKEMRLWNRLNLLMEVSNFETARVAVKAGLGVAFLPEVSVLGDLEDGTLVRVEVAGIAPRQTLYLCKAKGRFGSQAVDDLARLAGEELRRSFPAPPDEGLDRAGGAEAAGPVRPPAS